MQPEFILKKKHKYLFSKTRNSAMLCVIAIFLKKINYKNNNSFNLKQISSQWKTNLRKSFKESVQQ